MADQNTCIIGGQVYDAVEVPIALSALGCDGCELTGRTCISRKLALCTPKQGRSDGRYIVWKRRITNTPVEGL